MSVCKKCLSYLFELYDSIGRGFYRDGRMTYSPQAVANWFIGKAKKEGVPIDQLKLMKLVYIAQGASLAEGRELVGEKLYAWKYGPVFYTLFDSFRGQGMEPITKFAEPRSAKAIFGGDMTPENIDVCDIEAIKTLEAVWKYFGEMSGVKLSSWSHTPDGPWYRAKKEGLDIIPNDYVKEYFLSLAGSPQ